ncbi:hypothetical protein T265_08897 [Opisthorchis viverrini]|uniref:Uncharacterized protein n=1 Tax=Opisthorchis viverrini TaxID=6198 RepID=A0A074ZIM6_OPIVI|nr:hypothetical protein T265_08897 [Opisthorchis viverrini]KER23165.1 hypothetical protein T265_08897 [Opisthorchis viverrini]
MYISGIRWAIRLLTTLAYDKSRLTKRIVVKARSNNCCRPAKNTVGSDPGAILAVLNRLIASWRSAGVSNSAARTSFAAAQSIFRGATSGRIQGRLSPAPEDGLQRCQLTLVGLQPGSLRDLLKVLQEGPNIPILKGVPPRDLQPYPGDGTK